MQNKVNMLINGAMVFAGNREEAANLCYAAMSQDCYAEFGYIDRGTHYEVIKL